MAKNRPQVTFNNTKYNQRYSLPSPFTMQCTFQFESGPNLIRCCCVRILNFWPQNAKIWTGAQCPANGLHPILELQVNSRIMKIVIKDFPWTKNAPTPRNYRFLLDAPKHTPLTGTSIRCAAVCACTVVIKSRCDVFCPDAYGRTRLFRNIQMLPLFDLRRDQCVRDSTCFIYVLKVDRE